MCRKSLLRKERRGRDSNPRGLSPASFQDWCIEPLCHPSRRYARSAT